MNETVSAVDTRTAVFPASAPPVSGPAGSEPADAENAALPSPPRLTAADRYGDAILIGLPGMTDPCGDCAEERVCRECRYAAVVKALYCHEERDAALAEARRPVPPRFLPQPRPVFYPHTEQPDPVSALCEAIFKPYYQHDADTAQDQPRFPKKGKQE